MRVKKKPVVKPNGLRFVVMRSPSFPQLKVWDFRTLAKAAEAINFFVHRPDLIIVDTKKMERYLMHGCSCQQCCHGVLFRTIPYMISEPQATNILKRQRDDYMARLKAEKKAKKGLQCLPA